MVFASYDAKNSREIKYFKSFHNIFFRLLIFLPVTVESMSLRPQLRREHSLVKSVVLCYIVPCSHITFTYTFASNGFKWVLRQPVIAFILDV